MPIDWQEGIARLVPVKLATNCVSVGKTGRGQLGDGLAKALNGKNLVWGVEHTGRLCFKLEDGTGGYGYRVNKAYVSTTVLTKRLKIPIYTKLYFAYDTESKVFWETHRDTRGRDRVDWLKPVSPARDDAAEPAAQAV